MGSLIPIDGDERDAVTLALGERVAAKELKLTSLQQSMRFYNCHETTTSTQVRPVIELDCYYFFHLIQTFALSEDAQARRRKERCHLRLAEVAGEVGEHAHGIESPRAVVGRVAFVHGD